MSGEITITPAVESDLPSIKLLLQELMNAMEDTAGFDVEQSIENCRTLLSHPANYMLVARDGDEIVGFINFTTRQTIIHPGPSGLIDELVVTKSSRDLGVGKQLIRAVADRCREIGCSEVEVSTEKSNTDARRFYKSCGFDQETVLLELELE